jgi:hypothetical protein
MEIFQCQQCGDCCKGYGGTYLTEADIKQIADYINITPERFIQKYCVLSGKKYVLAQDDSSEYCIFWNKLCTIHPVKPKMCRAWPFIESILVDPGNWAIMGNSCPGINTHAPIEQVKQIINDKLAKSE